MEESAVAERKGDELMAVVEREAGKHEHNMRGDVRIRAERSPGWTIAISSYCQHLASSYRHSPLRSILYVRKAY